jgi:uncharacterized membrane protein YwaF
MNFEMWTWYHYLYIVSPFITIALLYFILKKASEKTKYFVGLGIGILSLLVLLTRNIDILVRNGFDPQTIPLQVCHFGNIVVFIALAFKSKIATAMAWCVNLIPAFASLIMADALIGYETIFVIRAQSYIWGHFFIVLGAMYPVVLGTIKFKLKDFLIALAITGGLFVISIVANTFFNDYLNYNINYFYVYNSSGVPFEKFYEITNPVTIGSWFTFNPMYVVSLIFLGLAVIWLMYGASKLMNRPAKIVTKQSKQ